jgi:GPH family glycoside/pentoside/hexuronide:cation symporter
MSDRSLEDPADPFREGRVLGFWQKLTYSSGQIGVNLAPGIVVGWVVYFYVGRVDADGSRILLVGAGAMASMNLLGRIVDALVDPLVGYYSDRWKTRWGRRIPWVVIGAPFLAAFNMLIWFPPQDHPGWGNTIWLGATLSGLWFFYTVAVAPYLSLLPEITPYRNERVILSAYMSYMVVAAMLVSTAGAGLIFDAYADGLDLGLFRLTNGFQVGGVVFALLTVLSFFLSVAVVRERPADEIRPVAFSFREAAQECSRNPAFWPYIFTVSLMRLGIDILVMMIPFTVTILMGYGEGVAGLLQGMIVLGAALLFPAVAYLANLYGKKRIMAIGLIGFVPTLVLLGLTWHFPFVGHAVAWAAGLLGTRLSENAVLLAHCVGLFAVGLFPVSVVLVLPYPIYADIMDYDERRTGYRREAMYNGMEGLITKFAAGIAAALVPLMLQYMGDTKEHPWGIVSSGPICGLFFYLAWRAFRRHPFDS